jgi:hypothetical protein
MPNKVVLKSKWRAISFLRIVSSDNDTQTQKNSPFAEGLPHSAKRTKPKKTIVPGTSLRRSERDEERPKEDEPYEDSSFRSSSTRGRLNILCVRPEQRHQW